MCRLRRGLLFRCICVLVIVALAVTFVAGCGGGGTETPAAERDVAVTDGSGQAPITVSGQSGAVEVTDALTGAPITGCNVTVLSNGGAGTVLITDPRDEYVPRLAPFELPTSTSAVRPQLAYSWFRKYVLQPIQRLTLGQSQIVYNDLLPAGMTKEVLEREYTLVDRVTLAQMSNKTRDWAIHWLVDKAVDAVIVTALSLAATPAAGGAYASATLAVGRIDDLNLIADSVENLTYEITALRYRMQGYADDQRFEIWGAKYIGLVYGQPLVIVPLEGPRNQPTNDLWSQLTWDTGTGDLDLHLLAPGCGLSDLWTTWDCYYGNMSPTWGAQLDLDDVDGYGPEHITMPTAVSGTYLLVVHYYSSTGQNQAGGPPTPVNCTVRVVTRTGPVAYGPRRLTFSGSRSGDVWSVAQVRFPEGTVTPLNTVQTLSAGPAAAQAPHKGARLLGGSLP